MIKEWWGRAKWLAWVTFDKSRSWGSWAISGGQKMFGLSWLSVLIPVATALVAGGWVWIDKEIEMAGVRASERAACTVQISNVRDAINEAADLRVAAAEAAALEVKDPATDAELEAICQADRYCRDREGK